MTPSPIDALELAFDRAVGRPIPRGAALPAGLLDFAARVVEIGRRVAAMPPCPARCVRRAEAVFRPPAARGLAALWDVLLDAMATPQPALRGGSRNDVVRVGGPGGSATLTTRALPRGAVEIDGRLEAPVVDAVVEFVKGRRRVAHGTVDAQGQFTLRLPRGDEPLALRVKVGRRVLARTLPRAWAAPRSKDLG